MIFSKYVYTIGFFVYYGCKTLKGSSGSPILKVVDGKLRVVAIHNGAADLSESRKYGIEFKAVLCHAGLEKGEGIELFSYTCIS